MGSTRWANPLDSMFLMGETRETLMHVAALMIFEPPADASDGFLGDLVEELQQTPVTQPWSLRLQTHTLLRQPVHRWVEDRHYEGDYHVRHSRLPEPGGERELGRLVSRLHSNQMDFHRPLWELHVIEGLSQDRFAIYLKMHHSLVDGFTGMKLTAGGMTDDPTDLTHRLFFNAGPLPRPAKARPPKERAERGADEVADLRAVLRLATGSIESLPAIGRAWLGAQTARLSKVARAARSVATSDGSSDGAGPQNGSVEPIGSLEAPVSILNGRVGRARRFATQEYELAQLRNLAAARAGTVNDALLAVCAGGLRRYLTDLGQLPDRPLIAFLPVNVRPKDSPGGGNLVAATLVSLATTEPDPVRRLEAIIASTRAAKARMEGMTTVEVLAHTAMLFAPAAGQVARAMSGLAFPGPITLNLCISNVPGPRQPLYLRGAKMLATFPVSIPGHSMALNITAHSYAGMMDLGFIGCRDSLPHLQRLAEDTGSALAELEAALSL